MLMLRLLSALILGPPALLFIYYSSAPAFRLGMLIILMIAGYEWSRLAGFKHWFARTLYILLLVAISVIIFHAPPVQFFSLVIVWWLPVIIWVIRYPKGENAWSNAYLAGLIGLVTISGFWYSMVYLKMHFERSAIFYVLFLVWIADSAAYFSGRRFGKNKLSPLVSPNKTWEGVWGAAFACAVYAVGWAQYFHKSFYEIITFLILSLICFVLSVIGDLAVSMFKRHQNLKDSGSLIPGHGGLLDRIDSLLSATPIFTLGLVSLNYKYF